MTDLVTPVLQQTRVLPLTRIQRERMLPVQGDVIATIGSHVDPLDIVARAPGESRLRPVPLARYMHLSESALPKYLLKQPGDLVEPREIIASKPELFGTLQRIYRAPGAGRIAAAQGSWLAVELTGLPFDLKALYRGVIVNVMPRLGVVVEAVGALVQAVWGGGGDGYGVLKKMVDAPDAVLTDDKIDVSARGAVLLAGAGATEQAIQRAAQERAAGLIVGGLVPRLRDLVTALALPTLLTEGFGEQPMSAPIFDLLAARDGKEISLSTAMAPRGGARRPEAFIPGAPTTELQQVQPPPPLIASIGATVRLLGLHSPSRVGKIMDVPDLPRGLESGVTAWGAEIEMTGGERIFVPWSNLELIG